MKGSRRRIAAMAAASWVLATTVTSLVVWQAVAVFSDGASTSVLSRPQVDERLEAAKAAITATPTPSDTPTPSPSATTPEPTSDDTSASAQPTSSPTSASTRTRPATTSPAVAATPVVTTWTVTGGTLSVSCQAQVITLVYASPLDGWRVDTDKHGTDRIEVNFQRVGQGTELSATCVNGVPQQTNKATDGDH